MLFNTWQFFVFLAVVLALYYSLRTLPQNRMLLVASYFFYGWWDWRFTSLLMISTIFDFHISIAIDNASDQRRRKLLLLVSIAVNFGMLGFFKYFNFFIDSAAHVIQCFGLQPHPPTLRIILPAGISFYTFQTMNYVIDVYRRKMKPTTDFLTYALFVAYFPHLVAGPIIRAEVLLPQLLHKRTVTNNHLSTGGVLILIGLFKKVVIADVLSPDVEQFFAAPHTFSSLLLLKGLYYFSLQIYCDFSGYTDIARGVSRLLGIELPENFNQPYLSRNITEFWRRWHISLSTWLRDYLYIPLGGNRRGRLRTYLNLLITMLLGGLWHGANWTFVVWGFLHGLYLAAHKFQVELHPITASVTQSRLLNVAKVFVTFHLVALTWICFRAPNFSTAFSYLMGILRWHGGFNVLEIASAIWFMAIVLVLDLPQYFSENHTIILRWPWVVRGLAYATMITLIFVTRSNRAIPFIYFQF
jgi:D-alanyl-lipoteichoic acid acyltransferase DltB (MBOAT superfamily)